MADEDEPMEEAPKLEPGPQKDEVMALFKTFDIEGTGKIEMKGLKAVKVEVGPSKMSVLDQLAEMDFNGDGYVEEDEWEMYFATVVAALDADSLKIILDDLKEAGRYDYSFSPLPAWSFLTLVACLHSTYATIANCVKMAEADDVTGGEPTEETELSEEESAAVKKLFEGWDFNGDGTIALSTLLTTGVDIGPRKEKVSNQASSEAARSKSRPQQRSQAATQPDSNAAAQQHLFSRLSLRFCCPAMTTQVFQALEQMDVNGDGKVTLEEMTNYFAVAKSLFPTTAQFIEVRAVPSPPSCVYSAVQQASDRCRVHC